MRNGKTKEWAKAYTESIQKHLDARETEFEIDANNPYDPPSISGIKNGLVAWQMNQMDWTTDGNKVNLTAESNVEMTSSTSWTAKYSFDVAYNTMRIDNQPSNAEAFIGSKVAFSVGASGAASYQWQSTCDKGASWWNMTEATAQKATVVVDCASYRIGRAFRCMVTFDDGSVEYSQPAWLSERRGITSSPQDASGAIGSRVSFSVGASGAASYQWQSTCDKGASWWNMTEATAQKATVVVDCASYRIGRAFRCMVTFDDGSVEYSQPAWLSEKKS